MQIHVVSPGESVWGIAQAYGTTPEEIIRANELTNAEQLVVGQALVIPIVGAFHWVAPGESIWQISNRYQVPVQQIIEANNLPFPPEQIPAGYRLYIPTQLVPKREIDIGAYVDVQITGENSANVVNEVGKYLTFVQTFSYRMNRDGSLVPVNDQAIINTAYAHRIVPLMVVTNISGDQFSTELATEILSSEPLQNRLLDNAMAIMEEKGYLGLDFDLEYLGAQNRERYNNFMRKARTRVDEKDYFLSSALAPKIRGDMEGVLYEGHDYRAHGEIVDFIFLMTYEWGWTGGPPMAVAPLNSVRRVIEYAASVIPANKIMMGIPLYGYDWTLPYVEGVSRARAIDHQEALRLARRYRAAIQYDYISQSPYFYYWDEQGRQHVVWFDDARSIQAKFNLVKEFGLRGFYFWVLGWNFPQVWPLIEDNFTVRKRVS